MSISILLLHKNFNETPSSNHYLVNYEYGPQARQAAAEALIRISKEYGLQYFITEVERTMSMLESDNAIIFTDTDMAVSFPDHRRPLYVEAQINDVFVRRALVDTRSSLNIIPLYVKNCKV